jgi:hypothetical protein
MVDRILVLPNVDGWSSGIVLRRADENPSLWHELPMLFKEIDYNSRHETVLLAASLKLL